MLTVNLFDEAFRHLTCSVHGKTAKHIEYVRDEQTWDGITILTDSYLEKWYLGSAVLKSRKTIGWLLEPREYAPQNYDGAERCLEPGTSSLVSYADQLDLLLTHDQTLLNLYPEKAVFVPFGGCWIQSDNIRMWPKFKKVSHIYSGKNFMEGHKLRHEAARRFPQVDTFGRGTPRVLAHKEAGLTEYRFSLVIENSRARNFFTEKLLDCMAVGTVPIYWGCPNIGDFFDPTGIIEVDDIDHLGRILEAIERHPDDIYQAHKDAAIRNLATMRQYEITDDWIALNVLEKL